MKANWKQPIFFLLLLIGTAIFIPLAAQLDKRKTKETMGLIPGGTFEMGQAKGDIQKLQQIFKISRADLFVEEEPKHRVKLNSFYLDKYEVTNSEFKRFRTRSGRKTRHRPNYITENTSRIGSATIFRPESLIFL